MPDQHKAIIEKSKYFFAKKKCSQKSIVSGQTCVVPPTDPVSELLDQVLFTQMKLSWCNDLVVVSEEAAIPQLKTVLPVRPRLNLTPGAGIPVIVRRVVGKFHG